MDTESTAHQTAMLLFAVFFASCEPISLNEIKSKLNIPEEEFLRGLEALRWILGKYTPLELQETEEKALLRTKAEFGEDIKAICKAKKGKLSSASLETLAIIAYKQPVMKSELDRIRGVDCESAIASLTQEGLIRALGNVSRPGSPIVYQTTEKFLVAFNLKGLKDLPELKDLIIP